MILATVSLFASVSAHATGTPPAGTAMAGPMDAKPSKEMMRQKMEERLMEMDANKDGAISKDEYIKQSEERFKRMDKNNDGKIDKSERDEMHDRMEGRRDKMGAMMGKPPADAPEKKEQ